MAVVDGVRGDLDAIETSEWLEAIDSVLEHDGPDRARQILTRVVERAQRAGTEPIATLNTPYLNTIPLEREAKLPGDPALERRLRSIVRWNAMAMVVRANKHGSCPSHPHARRGARSARRYRVDRDSQHAVRQHDPAPSRGALPGRSGDSNAASARSSAGTRSRWCVRANQHSSDLGGHIASFQSLATLYEVGFNHFWHAPSESHGGDLVYFQGHSSPGIYARAFLEGRLTEEQLDGFRQEVSTPGPELLPAPVADARLLAVLDGLAGDRPDHLDLPGAVHEVPAGPRAGEDGRAEGVGFVGDGEVDEPETMGSIGLAGREQLDNLIWVVNCNLQRLDGPVRGNGKIIQELESDFRGAGWNVIKVIWGIALGPAAGARHRRPAGPGDGGVRRRRVPDVQVARRRLRARALLRQGPGAARPRLGTCPTRRSGCSTAAASISRRSTPPTTRRFSTPVSRP